MIEQSVKSLPKTNPRNEISAEKKKRRPFSSDSGCSKSISPVRSTNKPSSGCPSQQLNLEMSSERQRLRMKLLESRNAAEETSEGVQQFFKHVSSYIRKNPFKDKPLQSSDTSEKAVVSSLDPIPFRKASSASLDIKKINPSSLERLSEMILAESKKSLVENPKGSEKSSSSQSGKKSAEVGNQKRKTSKGPRKTELGSKKAQKEPSPDTNRIRELLQTKKQAHRTAVETESRKEIPPEKATDSGERGREGRVLNAIKKKKPSEIPLRKKKSVSSRTQKTVSRVEQDSLDCCEVPGMNKCLSPLEELSVCSEVQLDMNEDDSYANQNTFDNESVLATTDKESLEYETETDKTLEMYFKYSGVSADYSNELLEDNSKLEKPLRLDLDKIKTTSFTILHNDGVLNRLESLHKQNVMVSSKTKVSIKTLKGKNSKKNLPRAGLKAKTKRSKREMNPTRREKFLKNEKTIRECLDSGKAWWESRKTVHPTKPPRPKEVGVSHVPVKLVRTKAKSLLRGIKLPKDADELTPEAEAPKIEDGISQKLSQETYKIDENKREGMGDSQSKAEGLVCPIPAPDKIVTQTNCRGAEDGVWPPNEKLRPRDSEWSVEQTVNKTPEDAAKKGSRGSLATSKAKTSGSKGTLEGNRKPSESDDTPRTMKRLKFDLQSVEDVLECERIDRSPENAESFDWLFMNEKDYDETPCDLVQVTNSESGRIAEEKVKNRQDMTADSLSSELAEEPGPLNLSIQKPQKSCSSIKRGRGEKRRLYKTPEPSTKTCRKKKIRPDAGGRRLSSPNGFFNSEITLLNKVTGQRSDLIGSHIRDEKKDIFEDAAAAKLKRRNSEPYCLRGYVWKCADVATTRGHKPSVSSMASSLRHLNTDDIDDFIFWEAVPQRKTAWETSLYHFKRPWSLLSCSVFKDNRRSSTPGVILENLRNGGALRRFGASESERLRFRKENPFDVEPSIAQKNIDIRNWLAALNFPTIPSTSSDFLSESNFGTQSTSEPQNRNKIQTAPRRRKIGPNLKFSEEPGESRCEEKEKLRKSTKRSGSESESLTELTRRKSGGFVTEQHMNSEHAIRRPNATINLCVYSKSAEESLVTETTDRNCGAEPRKFKSFEDALQPQASIFGSPAQGDQAVEKCVFKKKQSEVEIDGASFLRSLLKGELSRIISGFNIWKYLFMCTVVIVAIHCFFLRS